MLAAPKKYPFGTKIYIEGYGVWEVADRWGAIVSTDDHETRWYEYDRIDIWMGYGEAGLARALSVWKKTICNSMVLEDDTTQVTIDITRVSSANLATRISKKQPINIYASDIGPKSSIEDVAVLHSYLHELGLYDAEINSRYNKDTIKWVYLFQYRNKIVTSTKNNGAWLWEIQTRTVAQALLARQELQKSLLASSTSSSSGSLDSFQDNQFSWVFDKNLTPQSASGDIMKLQQVFQKVWMYSWSLSGNYQDIKDTLISYQLNQKIVRSSSDDRAGYFGPMTRNRLKIDYLAFQQEQKKLAENQQSQKALIEQINQELSQKVTKHIASIGSPKEGDSGVSVRNLQKTLNTLWYFNQKDTGNFWARTKDALIKYQLDKKIITNAKDPNAGLIWPKTRQSLQDDLLVLLREKILNEKKLLVYKK